MAKRLHEQYRNEETGEYTPEFNAFEEAILAAGATDFDCEQVASALARGLTPEAAAAEFNKDRDAYAEDFEDRLNHDTSMNG